LIRPEDPTQTVLGAYIGTVGNIDNAKFGIGDFNTWGGGTLPTGNSYGGVITFKIDATKMQVAFGWDSQKAYMRRYMNNAWDPWTEL